MGPGDASIVSEHLPLGHIRPTILPSGERRIKRVAYLAQVRNRALHPLDVSSSSAASGDDQTTTRRFDKLLFLNDVVFSPLDAAQLLFSTNIGHDGRTDYRAACALDFINPFKFYDTFASRDREGYSMGLPFFPWFSAAGAGASRRDVLAGKDAVRVRSCWGGMVAFEAKWFQTDARATPSTTPLRFRAEPDTFWDASECCLIHADLQPDQTPSDPSSDTRIFVNPFVRVAYGSRTHSWLSTTRRWERLYPIPHHLINKLVGLPFFNPRRTESEGDQVMEQVWIDDDGSNRDDNTVAHRHRSFQTVQRTAQRGGFCGSRKLLVLKEKPSRGEQRWESLPVPPV